MGSSRIERYRKEIRSLDYTPLSDEELKEVQEIYRSKEYLELTGQKDNPEVVELLEMFIEEKLPPDLSQRFVIRYVNEEITSRHTQARSQKFH